MRRLQRFGVACLILGGLAAVPMFLNAQDSNAPAEVPAEGAVSADEVPLSELTLADLLNSSGSAEDALPAELQDLAFRRYVNISLLAEAWGNLDAGLMTDVALQLKEGERVLRRPHHAISSAELLKVAAKIAGENKDEDTLARITAVADEAGDKELVGQITAAAKMGGASRDMEPEFQIPVADLSPEQLADIQDFMQAVRASKLANDAEALKWLASQVETLQGLTDDQKATLKKSVTDSHELAAKSEVVDPAIETLDKIEGATRGDGFSLSIGNGGFGISVGNRRGGGRFGGGQFGGGRFGGGRFGRFGGGQFGGGRFGRFGGGQFGGGRFGRFGGSQFGGGRFGRFGGGQFGGGRFGRSGGGRSGGVIVFP